MDEWRAYLNSPCSSTAQRVKLRGPLTGGIRITKEDATLELGRREEHCRAMVPSGTDYARELKEREAKIYSSNEREKKDCGSVITGLDSLEKLSLGSFYNIDQLTDEAMTTVYSKYSFQTKEDTKNLAINDSKEKILKYIKAYPVVIIDGPTGCGKTTQVPQWILDDHYKNRRPCKIVVTQPRRIAAVSIAKRVAQERGWNVGGLVGYQVGLDNTSSSDTRILYVTTGILLQKLVSTKTLDEYTHIILDEIHERDQEMDFLMLVVKKLLFTKSPNVRIVLMSATFNMQAFVQYFLIPTPIDNKMTATVSITNKEPMFSVNIYYLTDLGQFNCGLTIKRDEEPIVPPDMHYLVLRLINAFERIDQREDNYPDRSQADLPSVLIFLPGISDIEDLYECLMDLDLRAKLANEECRSYKWWVLPLHSTITAEEQARVFQRAPPGHRKIILSTNIAESSITVPDIKYVVDYCLIKELVVENSSNFTTLKVNWASKTNCIQRAGRAGRVRDGRVYRLVSKKFYETLKEECTPEIVQSPLERLVLLAKTLDMGPPSNILALAMDPPDMSNIHRTILVLKEIGALKKTMDGQWSSSDGDLTYMGRIMAKLPLDVKMTKLIVFGYIFGCLDECVIMAAAMTVRSLFSSPFRERLNAYNSKLTWADGSTSDCIAFLNVYKVWNHLRKQQYFKQAGNNESQWAHRFYVQVRALRELDDMVRELRRRLSREGIDTITQASPWAKHELPLVLKIVIAGAFYPQYFTQVSLDEARECEAVRCLAGNNPRTTVYLKNFPDNQPGEIYAATIKNIIRKHIGDEPRVTFDTNSQKVYLSFEDDAQGIKHTGNNKDPTIPGQVVLPVYKAVKARLLRMEIRIPMLPVEKAKELKENMDMQKCRPNLERTVPKLPDIDDTHFPLKISYKASLSSFWVQYDDSSTAHELYMIGKELSSNALIAYTGDVHVGDLFAAPLAYERHTVMRRVRIVRVLAQDMFEVQCIDYGGYGRVHVGSLRVLPGGVSGVAPPLAMRCALAGVRAAPLLDAHDHWPRAADHCFQTLTSRKPLLAKVYSVVKGTVMIELLAEGGEVSINEELVKQNYAVRCEESYESKLNHDLRQTANELNMAQKRAYNKEQMEQAYNQMRDMEPPRVQDCISDISLKGPFSPLETVLHSLMYSSREKNVQIEWNSVNSIILDTAPQELYERLLVAAEVGQSDVSNRMTLRHTTLMPNIPALPAIIALLFCPVAELRCDEQANRYVSALCGLGSTEDGMPYFPEHDLLVSIDADLSVDDIGLINHIRYLMDYVLYCEEGQDRPATNDEFFPHVPKTIRTDLINLVMVRRKHREPRAIPKEWEWKAFPDLEYLEILDPDMVERAELFPLHVPMALRPPSRDQLLQRKLENDQLKLLVSRTPISSNTEVVCKLCDTNPMSTPAMRLHLYSNAHKEREEDFRSIQS